LPQTYEVFNDDLDNSQVTALQDQTAALNDETNVSIRPSEQEEESKLESSSLDEEAQKEALNLLNTLEAEQAAMLRQQQDISLLNPLSGGDDSKLNATLMD